MNAPPCYSEWVRTHSCQTHLANLDAAEDMEYDACLTVAAGEEDSLKRIAFVGAFAMSNYSSTIGRVAKPFNPLLSQSYEYAIPNRYRYISEQVSHHPVSLKILLYYSAEYRVAYLDMLLRGADVEVLWRSGCSEQVSRSQFRDPSNRSGPCDTGHSEGMGAIGTTVSCCRCGVRGRARS